MTSVFGMQQASADYGLYPVGDKEPGTGNIATTLTAKITVAILVINY
jgi:hypothetical protein